jgi:hypothetical protein
MSSYSPAGFEQVPLVSESPWDGDPNADITTIEALGILKDAYRYVGQGRIYPVEPHIKVVASEGFVNCSAFILRNLVSRTDTFSHFWPSETDYEMEQHLRGVSTNWV